MEKDSKFTRPSGLVASKVVMGTNPPKLPNSSTPSSKIQTHLFIKGTEPKQAVTYEKPKEENNNEEESIPEELAP